MVLGRWFQEVLNCLQTIQMQRKMLTFWTKVLLGFLCSLPVDLHPLFICFCKVSPTPLLYASKNSRPPGGIAYRLHIDCLSIPNALPIDCQWDANGLALSGSTCQDHIIALRAHYMDFAPSAPFYRAWQKSDNKVLGCCLPRWLSDWTPRRYRT